MEHQKNFDNNPKEKEFVEKLVTLNRTCKTVKGGRRMSFSALTVVGDQKGRIGYGLGKANDVSEAIKKSIDKAKRNLITMPLKNGTIPHDIIGNFGSASVLLKKAPDGTGIIAGGPARNVLELAGLKNIRTKSLGSNNKQNVVLATIEGLSNLKTPEEVAKLRGKTVEEILG